MSDSIRVLLIGDHPWSGHSGTIAVVNGKVTVNRPLGFLSEMVTVELDNGHSAMATKDDIRVISKKKGQGHE